MRISVRDFNGDSASSNRERDLGSFCVVLCVSGMKLAEKLMHAGFFFSVKQHVRPMLQSPPVAIKQLTRACGRFCCRLQHLPESGVHQRPFEIWQHRVLIKMQITLVQNCGAGRVGATATRSMAHFETWVVRRTRAEIAAAAIPCNHDHLFCTGISDTARLLCCSAFREFRRMALSRTRLHQETQRIQASVAVTMARDQPSLTWYFVHSGNQVVSVKSSLQEGQTV
mgnify:CR=1 FL=1